MNILQYHRIIIEVGHLILKNILDFLYSGERNFKDVLSDYWRLPKLHKISALAIKDLTVIKRNIG